MATQLSGKLPLLYKGLALFTPGGDLVYCLDPSKQGHWHAQLCMSLQQLLDLSAPPLFLTPCYTATVDRWLDSRTQDLHISAEAYPQAWRYRALLSHLFNVDINQWQLLAGPPETCDPPILMSYREQFPQLWESHNLVVPLDQVPVASIGTSRTVHPPAPRVRMPESAAAETRRDQQTAAIGAPQGCVLQLFISDRNPHMAQVLEKLHQVLDEAITDPYTLKIIDVTKHPDQAEVAQVTATPTLMRTWPLPIKRVVGGLEQTDRILQLLDYPSSEAAR